MTKFPELKASPIDAVITWVDGNSTEHLSLRQKYMSATEGDLCENAINPHRWSDNDEVLYCIQSIGNYAPWIRKIWILVDEITPDISSLSQELRSRVCWAYHHNIFEGHEDVLPTFNSLAIESMLWRIKGLSDRFIYFNDDMFFAAPIKPTDVFQGDTPVLRGDWLDYSETEQSLNARLDPAKFNDFMQINAAKIIGFHAAHMFAEAHVMYPMRKSVMERLFVQYNDEFIKNISYRFRDLRQFLPQGLHNHACIAEENFVQGPDDDHVHIWSGQGKGQSPNEVLALLQNAVESQTKFLCINDLPQLEELVPDARELLADAVGGFPGK